MKEFPLQPAATLNTMNTEVDLFGGAYLKSPNGMFAEVAFGFDNFYQCNYEIWGSKGKIIAQRAFTPGVEYKPRITLEQQGDVINYEIDAENHFVNILNYFDCGREKRRSFWLFNKYIIDACIMNITKNLFHLFFLPFLHPVNTNKTIDFICLNKGGKVLTETILILNYLYAGEIAHDEIMLQQPAGALATA